jgi:hypothetical protein
MQERRNEEIAKYEQRRKEKEEQAEANGEEVEEEDFDIEAIIQDEFSDELQVEKIFLKIYFKKAKRRLNI